MLRFIGLLVLLAASFALGYMTGQLPLHPLSEKVRELSKNVLDTTLGLERDLRQRQGLIDAKGHLVQAKAHLADHNYGSAGRELAESVDALEQALQGGKDQTTLGRIRALSGEARELKLELSMGKKIPPARVDELQKELDQLLRK